MTKQEYIKALDERLKDYPADFRNEILEAFEGHFQEGLDAGQSEDEIVENLGTVEEVTENIRMMQGPPDTENDLYSSLNDLKHTLADTIRTVTDVVAETVSTAADALDHRPQHFDASDNLLQGTLNNTKAIRIRTHKAILSAQLIPGDRLTYEFSSKRNLFSRIESSLQIMEADDETSLDIYDGHAVCTLTVPACVHTIDFEISGGEIMIDDLRLNRLIGTAASADIDIHRTQAEFITVRSTSGDIKVKNTGFTQLEATSASGDIDLKHCQGNAELKCSSGDISTEDVSGNILSASCASGDLDIDPVQFPVIRLKTASGDIELHAYEYPERIEANSVSGDIDIELENTDYTAEISTISGDIDIGKDIMIQRRAKHRITAGRGRGIVSIHSVSGDVSLF